MTDSVREQIGQQLLLHMQGITKANEFETDIGQRYTRAQKSMDPEEIKNNGAHGTFFLGPEDRDNKYGFGGRSMEVNHEIYDYVRASDVEKQDVTINRLDADITKRLEIPGQELAALVESITVTGIEPEYVKEAGHLLCLLVRTTVVYSVQRGDPSKVA